MDERYLKAIQLRYQGRPAAEIAGACEVSVGTVGNWFMVGGQLHDEYEKYEEEQNKLRRDEAKNVLKKNIQNAAKILVMLLGDEDSKVKLTAAREILDREMGKPVQPILQGDAGFEMIEQLKKELGIDEESLRRLRSVDQSAPSTEAVPVSEGDSAAGTPSSPDGEASGEDSTGTGD